MIVNHKWNDKGACSRCDALRRKRGTFWQYRWEGAAWWADWIADCRGDMQTTHRVVRSIKIPNKQPFVVVTYRGTFSNCVLWLADHKKLVGDIADITAYSIETKETGTWQQASSSSGASVAPAAKPSIVQSRKPNRPRLAADPARLRRSAASAG